MKTVSSVKVFTLFSYYECLKDVSRFNDGVVAIRGRGYIQYLEAVSVVHADVAPDDLANGEQVTRGSP